MFTVEIVSDIGLIRMLHCPIIAVTVLQKERDKQ